MGDSTTVKFVNHASVLVKHGSVSVLSDPWYQGDAFHKGWSLTHELTDNEILGLLDEVTHIWISHEHPDHFSILFFKKFGNRIKELGIKILFQNCQDQRVESFLSKSGFQVRIIEFDTWLGLSDDFEILCFKHDFYDSGLAIRTNDKTIINVNDCQFNDEKACKKLVEITGECDILITQFSYASWKGGVENTEWRRLAAKEKIDTMRLQASYLKPKVVIPFASFIYFSNKYNYYLNDAHNTPLDVVNGFLGSDVAVKIMKPFEVFSSLDGKINNDESIEFWEKAESLIDSSSMKQYDTVPLEKLKESFLAYKSRVFKNNTAWLMLLARYLSPVPAFRPVIIEISDLNASVCLDFFSKGLIESHAKADISMHSESLNFLMSNTFGFDTLTVNGCFEEVSDSGFSRFSRSLALENLNNMGIEFRPSIILNFRFIIIFMKKLWMISRKLKLGNLK